MAMYNNPEKYLFIFASLIGSCRVNKNGPNPKKLYKKLVVLSNMDSV